MDARPNEKKLISMPMRVNIRFGRINRGASDMAKEPEATIGPVKQRYEGRQAKNLRPFQHGNSTGNKERPMSKAR